MMQNHPCARMRAMRTLKKMSMSDLASQVGITASYVSHMESGKRQPSPELGDRINLVLGPGAVELPDLGITVPRNIYAAMLDELHALQTRVTSVESLFSRLLALEAEHPSLAPPSPETPHTYTTKRTCATCGESIAHRARQARFCESCAGERIMASIQTSNRIRRNQSLRARGLKP